MLEGLFAWYLKRCEAASAIIPAVVLITKQQQQRWNPLNAVFNLWLRK
jgi:hypothetical protein